MKYTLFTALATAFTSFANAFTAPVGDPQGNPIYKPGLNEIVPVGAPYTITWDPTTEGTVTLVLLRGPSTNVVPLYPIVEKIPNTGTYSWTPAADLEADVSHYGIQLIVDATGQYQYTTQFGISNSGPAPSPSPSSSSTLPPSLSLYSFPPSSSSKPPSKPSSSSVAPTYSVPTSVVTHSGNYTHTGGFITSGTVVYSTSMVTVTSCGPAVTNCPGKPQTPTALPKPSVWTSPAWNATVSKPVAPTGYTPTSYPSAVPSANVTKSPVPVVPVSPGAGDKIRVGGAMFVVMVAGFALVL